MSDQAGLLIQMVEDRKKLFVYDETETLTKESDRQIDEAARAIRAFIVEHQDSLPVEVMIESLTMLGAAPSVLYDDNGHFTIGADGTQNLPTFDEGWEAKETTFSGTWWVEPGMWKETIREAMRAYLEKFCDDSVI